MSIPEFLTLEQISKKLNISKITLRRYIKTGRLKGNKIGKEYRITPGSTESFISSFEDNKKQKNPIDSGLHHDPIKTPHEKKPKRGLAPFHGINSPVTETLVEMLNQRISMEEIQEIIANHAKDCIELIEKIEQEGIKDSTTALTLLLIDEAIKNLQIRRKLFTRILNKQTIVLLPLPPHLSDGLLTVASHDLVFISDKNLPPHLRYVRYDYLEHFTLQPQDNRLKNVDSIVVEAYLENNNIYIRSNAINLIHQLKGMGLKEIYLHSMPHIPPHAHFIELDTRNLPAEILKI